MSDVFGGKGAKRGTSGTSESAPQTTRTKPTMAGNNCYIEYDNDTGEMRLTLPTHLRRYKERLTRDLYEEYFLANPDEATMGSISDYIDTWLEKNADDFPQD
jgi:hypothetical protein